MSNSNYNIYPVLAITPGYQVIGYDSNEQSTSLSNENFALDIGISEDGTLWAISVTPDPDGGGGRIFWSQSAGEWNEISTSDPGGIKITGASGDTCFFLSADGSIWSMNTQGQGSKVYDQKPVYSIDAGGEYIWATFPENDGDMLSLHYSKWNTPFSWQKFQLEEGALPYSLSVGYQGNCYGAYNSDPMYYANDGTNKGSAGSGLNGNTFAISSKNWSYALSYNADENGNEIYKWEDTEGGKFVKTSMRGSQVLSTFHLAS